MSEVGHTDPPPKLGNSDERNWALLCHLSSFAGYLVPFGNILGPLAVWLIKKDEYPLVDDQGKEAMNFQISIMLYLIVSAILCIILIGFLLLLAVVIFDLVMTIIAAIEASKGNRYRYPLCIRLIS